MDQPPKWFLPAAVVALLWNLMGCAAYVSDVSRGPDDVAAMTDAMRALYNSRPAWSVAATAIAVWFGAAGSLGLVMRKRWAMPLLVVSLLGVIVQDVWFLMVRDQVAQVDSTAMMLQSLVLVVAVALVLLARTATAKGWLAPRPA